MSVPALAGLLKLGYPRPEDCSSSWDPSLCPRVYAWGEDNGGDYYLGPMVGFSAHPTGPVPAIVPAEECRYVPVGACGMAFPGPGYYYRGTISSHSVCPATWADPPGARILAWGPLIDLRWVYVDTEASWNYWRFNCGLSYDGDDFSHVTDGVRWDLPGEDGVPCFLCGGVSLP